MKQTATERGRLIVLFLVAHLPTTHPQQVVMIFMRIGRHDAFSKHLISMLSRVREQINLEVGDQCLSLKQGHFHAKLVYKILTGFKIASFLAEQSCLFFLNLSPFQKYNNLPSISD